MSTDAIVIVVVLFLLIILNKMIKRSKPQNKLIKEPLIKILYNPIIEKWMWTKFNPKSRIWEWQREATETEVGKYKDMIFGENIGDKILSEDKNNG